MTPEGLTLLQDHEGKRLKPYDDATGEELLQGSTLKGNITIGWGCNLSAGISHDEAVMLLDTRINRATAQARGFSWFDDLDSVRQDVVVMMIFALGLNGFKGFKNMIGAIERGDWADAAFHLQNSKAAREDWQPSRGKELGKALEHGAWGITGKEDEL